MYDRSCRVRISSAVLVALCFAVPLAAKHYSFRTYGQADGLGNLNVVAIAQDREGYLWAGTDNGAYRYDGARFSHFGTGEGLPSDALLCLHRTARGTLWAATRAGVARWNGNHFIPVPIPGTATLKAYGALASTSDGSLYLATPHGLAIANSADNLGAVHFRFLTHAPVSGVSVDAGGAVWFGADSQLWQLNGDVPVALNAQSKLPPDAWEAMLTDAEGNFWARSATRLISRAKGAAAFIEQKSVPRTLQFGSLYATNHGQILVPTIDGLVRSASRGWERIGSEQGLASDMVGLVFQDREGSVWIGLNGQGLQRWIGYDSSDENWKRSDGLSGNAITGITRDRAGQLWVGTNYGLDVLDQPSSVWRLAAAHGENIAGLLSDDAEGAIWFGTSPGKLHRLDLASRSIRSYGKRSGLTEEHIRGLAKTPDGELWICTNRGLFHGMAARSPHFRQFAPPGTDADEAFYSAIVDRQNRLWVGGSRGLLVREGNQWRRFGKPEGFAGDGVYTIAEAPDGDIYFAYYSNSGFSRIRLGDRVQLQHFSTRNGLTSNAVVSLGFDLAGRLWAGGDNGIDVRSAAGWTHYGKEDGLVWDDCNSALFADADGSVWVGTSNGLSHFRQPGSASVRMPPPIYITKAVGASRVLDLSGIGSIPFADRSLLFQFASPTFLNEAAVRIHYRLAGLERDWTESEVRSAKYANVPPGKYRLEVAARSAKGVWSAKPATFEFRVEPAWWQRWQLRGLVGVIIVGLCCVLWQLRVRMLMRKQAQLENLLEQARTADRLKSEALTKMKRAEIREKGRNRILELVGSHQPLSIVLDAIIELVESEDSEALAILFSLRDRQLFPSASRRMPAEIVKQFEGIPVASAETCFASAAHQAQSVCVPDIAVSPLWSERKSALAGTGVVCCRSAAVLSSSGEVLGVLTCFRKSYFLDNKNFPSLDNAQRLASLAIEHLSLYQQLSRMAQYDELTGLPNRALFGERLQQAIARADRSRGKLCVLWLDLDGFKHVNDTLGHQTGDALLQTVSHRIRNCLRRDDTPARMGGDEFTVILESRDRLNVAPVIQKLISAIAEPLRFGDRDVFVTASVGVSVYPDDARNAEELIRNADLAMYHVKRLGKNAHDFFVPEMASREATRIEIESHLRGALASHEFELVYQPQFDLHRNLAGFEALLRWTNPKLGAVSPSRFIPIAEDTGLIVSIGQWVLEEACRQTAAWRRAGFQDFRMSVNVSALQFGRPEFTESVARTLVTSGVPAESIEIEITETAIMSDAAQSAERLRKIRELGVSVAIDDFGTGYSSLSYLQKLPADAIKIDQSFVRDLDGAPACSLTMIQAIVNLARGLGLRVVAEGVETEAQLEMLREAGCDLAQGYLLDRPLSRTLAMELLSARGARPLPITKGNDAAERESLTPMEELMVL